MEKLGSFYRDNKRTLFAYLMRMTGDYYLASDIKQESFTRFLERYDGQAPNTESRPKDIGEIENRLQGKLFQIDGYPYEKDMRFEPSKAIQRQNRSK